MLLRDVMKFPGTKRSVLDEFFSRVYQRIHSELQITNIMLNRDFRIKQLWIKKVTIMYYVVKVEQTEEIQKYKHRNYHKRQIF